jgi:predicted permease
MALWEVYNQLGILFLTIMLGYILGKIKLITATATQVFATYVLKVAIPALILSGMQIPYSPEKLHTALLILGLSIPCYGLAFAVSKFSAHLLTPDSGRRAIYCFGLIFSNCGFIAFPVFQALYGKESLFYAAIFNIPYNLLLYTLGIRIMGPAGRTFRDRSAWREMLNPGIIACFLGFFLFLTAIPLPQFVAGTIDSLGNTSIPISMILIGAMLSELPLPKTFTDRSLYFLTLVRLIAMPVLTFILLKYILRLDNLWLIAIPVITAGMPVAANASLMAREYENDTALAAQTILITTLASCITIPLLAYFLQIFLTV